MTVKTLTRALRRKKPAVIKESGEPRFLVLDWETWHRWEEMREDIEDQIRLEIALQESEGKRRYTFEEVKKKYRPSCRKSFPASPNKETSGQ